ncbi:hypothetical protein Q5H93_17090 [Hymenobacter sp. ASUV-10]|uniref:O-antigen ligase domain-containing protein n=1 Tax=Hymenobacter aranciens TaxID=3063996 RepID=A0ABT9BIX0_9BACT|nr:hypothetical protein [Hymenobacter sp. ASUV-10]MDO7876463.1 hypothetical protein [Hymenobacter sp. ASUV-10]
MRLLNEILADMSPTERLVMAGLGGGLGLLVLYFFGAGIQRALELLLSVALTVAYFAWLYVKRHERHWLPLAVQLSCLLLVGLTDKYVFQLAQVESYSREVGWFSDSVSYSPNYVGEWIPLVLVLLSPLLGLLGLWIMLSANRARQLLHYVALLVVMYPALAFMVFIAVEGNLKPRFSEGAERPAIGTKHVRNDTKY